MKNPKLDEWRLRAIENSRSINGLIDAIEERISYKRCTNQDYTAEANMLDKLIAELEKSYECEAKLDGQCQRAELGLPEPFAKVFEHGGQVYETD